MAQLQVVLTGATGTVGGFLAPALAAAGHQVIAISRRKVDFPHGELVITDLANPLRPLPRFTEAITVHCAALTTDGWSRTVEEVNDLLTRRALQLSDGGFIHLSSSSVYDLSHDSVDIRPDAADGKYRFFNSYSRSKFSSEQIVFGAQRAGILLRAHGIYGPNDRTLLPRIRRSIRRGVLPLPNGGRRLHAFTSLDTLSNAVLDSISALGKGNLARPQAVNITDNHPLLLRDAVLMALGGSVRVRDVPTGLALALGRLFELRRKSEPAFSRYVVRQLAHERTYNLDLAGALIGYDPLPPKFEEYFGGLAATEERPQTASDSL